MEYLTSGFEALLTALFWVAAGLSGSWAVGSFVVPRLAGADTPSSTRHLLSVGTGLAIVSLLILGLGSAGAARPAVFRGLMTALLILGLARAIPAAYRARASMSVPPVMFWCVLGVLAMAALILLLPPAGTDSLSYHLSDPKYFLLSGKIEPIPFSRESLWPYLTEMFFLAGLGCQGTTTAVAWHWIFYPLTAWAAWALGVRMGGADAGKWAAWIWVMTPAAFAQSADAYIDLAFAFYAALVFVALDLWLERPGRGRALLLGLAVGGCLSVKLLGIGLAAAVAAAVLWKSRNRMRDLALVAAGALVLSGIWYARSWWVLGNPVFPFFPQWFGGNGVVNDIAGKGAGTGWQHLVLLPWNLAMRPYAFGGEIAGPWLVLFGWAGIGLQWRRPNGQVLAATALATAVFLFSQSQMTRFFMMLFPWIAALSALGYVRLRANSGAAARAAVAAMMIISVFHLAISAYRLRDAAALAAGRLTPTSYLEKTDRSYRAYAYLNREIAPGERVLNAADAKRFWGPTKQMTVVNGIMRNHWGRSGVTIPEFLERENFDWLMLTERSDPAYWAFARANGYREMFGYDFREPTEIMKFRILKKESR